VKAVVQDRYGSADVLRIGRVPMPDVQAGHVLVRVVAAGVDRGAAHLMRGRPLLVRLGHGLRSPKSVIPGTNVAGIVDSVGNGVSRVKPGDSVYGTCVGALAEYAAIGEGRLAAKPEALTFEEAAVLPYAGTVALQALEHTGIEPGRSALVVGASGAVGTVAVQIARCLGASVTGVCSAPSAELVRSLGAEHVIDYATSDIGNGRARFDVILDIAGNTPLRVLRRSLAAHGTLVLIGGEGGGRVLGGLQRQLAAVVLSPFVRQRLATIIARDDAETLERLNALVDAGGVRPVMSRCAHLEDAAGAFSDLEARATAGRIALNP
jgi:NADPH:quinone reductase-like Zn-dependent oxidoreductase